MFKQDRNVKKEENYTGDVYLTCCINSLQIKTPFGFSLNRENSKRLYKKKFDCQ